MSKLWSQTHISIFQEKGEEEQEKFLHKIFEILMGFEVGFLPQGQQQQHQNKKLSWMNPPC